MKSAATPAFMLARVLAADGAGVAASVRRQNGLELADTVVIVLLARGRGSPERASPRSRARWARVVDNRDIDRHPTAPAEAIPGAQRTAIASLAAAFVLVALKLGTGLATGSLALVSAGVESSGDVIAALLTLGAIRIAGRPADREHNYGHRRAENIAALETPVTRTVPSTDDELERSVTRLLGRAPLDVQARDTESGPVAFLTIAVDADTDLAAAHDLASQLERELRLERPDLIDVVVHTEPS